MVVASRAVACFLIVAALEGECTPEPNAFVRVDKQAFVIDNSTAFHPAGANLYWALGMMIYGEHTRVHVRYSLDRLAAMNTTIVRFWAFGEGEERNERPMQTYPGEYDEEVLKALDTLIDDIAQRGMRATLVLCNYWQAFGGAGQYVQWARELEGQDVHERKDFFTNNVTRQWYKNHLETILERHNTIRGLDYREDGAIFSYELINEPRVPGDTTGDVLVEWVASMAAFAKAIDGNHLLTTGSEGFWGKRTPELMKVNPSSDAFLGVDQVRIHEIEDIDYASFHLWPDNWFSENVCSAACKLNFTEKWLAAQRETATRLLSKPSHMGEYNKLNNEGEQLEFYRRVYDFQERWDNQLGAGGEAFWYSGHWDVIAHDDYAVYFFQDGLIDAIRAHNSNMSALVASFLRPPFNQTNERKPI